ncbi:endonuclease/exonuclease/phosphatase family protein [Ruegeria faecimaris]|uniref:Metal-dependent hydrolase, endonuclease/exonuclease/phosphatase family n=1 Tax=Ruegeria faecimaris TaxID=686389 RepID=A0A521E564_9RHOB|nr:endonuclease/exonuclease/phosphatase family protein [Ruegeria faecimaris]SMO79088.1 Metal-dependent hydrolase, endonuclease/exonuclease/phosphatase family [Ruegeria faecimaris]
MIRVFLLLLLPFAAQAETIRIATFNTELSRKGPGILLRDIRRGDAQVRAVMQVLLETQPDIVALQGIDWDLNGETLTAFGEALRDEGLDYPYRFTAKPNSGMETSLDLDGDGQVNGPRDSQGYGEFTGQGGLAILSRFPISHDDMQDFSGVLWRDLPGADLPTVDGTPFPSEAAQRIQRLSSVAHWIVPIESPIGHLNLMTFHATPPVFDGPEDRNGLRNRDEIRLWNAVLDGALGPAPHGPFVIAGDANLDPTRGEGRKEAIQGLLADPRLQDAKPATPSGALATVEWKAVGEMRVDYVLPSADLRVVDAGIFWPDTGADLRAIAEQASRHRLVWVDLGHR